MRSPFVRHFGAAVCVSLLLSACARATPGSPTVAPSQPTKTLNLAAQDKYSVVVFLAGNRYGLFKDAGISDVKVTLFTSIPAMIAAVAQGQMDVGIQTVPAVVSYNTTTTGTKIKFLSSAGANLAAWYVKDGDNLVPVATKDSWEPTVATWKGKKIGVSALGGIVEKHTRYMLEQAGLQPDADAKFVATGGGEAAAAALKQGVVDVTSGDASVGVFLKSQQVGHAVLDQALQQGPPLLLDTIVTGFLTSDARVQADRNLFVGIVDGMVRAKAFLADPANKQAVIDVLTQDVELPAGDAEAIYSTGIPQRAQAQMTRAIWDKTIAAFLASGILSGDAPAYSDYVVDFAK